MAKKLPVPDPFVFQRTDRIGVAAAEEDREFLQTCFVDTGMSDLLHDVADNRLIVLGRTGAGKSALFDHLKTIDPDHVIELLPENLALTYLGHSTMLNTYSSLGINLDPFFALLWRHIFSVEILSKYFRQYGTQTQRNLWEWLISLFTGASRQEKEMKEAIAYLREWGEEFWLETEYRVKEITQRMETQLTDSIKAQLGGKYGSLGLEFGDVSKLSTDEKVEIQKRGQEVVSKAQVKDLHQVMRLLDNILGDKQKQYVVLVDRLDDNWVEDKLRYRLIMALIQTAKEFIKVDNAKIIIALRRDLIERVFRNTRGSGFQEEKVESVYLPLVWTKSEILDLLDRRVTQLVRRRYTRQKVGFRDLLPNRVHGISIDDYIFDIAKRPRDVIAFFNVCIQQAAGHSALSLSQLAAAESAYSAGRLKALADEWSGDYPELLDFCRILNGRPSTFKLDTIDDKDVTQVCLDVVSESEEIPYKSLLFYANEVIEQRLEPIEFKVKLFQAFYRVGLIGLKLSPQDPPVWLDDEVLTPVKRTVDGNTSAQIAAPYIRGLGVVDKVHCSP